jgi:intracellular multiplication protein IcmJ
MNTIPIVLGIARSAGNSLPSPKDKSADLTTEIRQKIFERDKHVCHCCGFASHKYQDIHYINHLKGDNRPENLATVCIFCSQCFNLQDVPTMRSGVMIWLPEIAQADLHHVARAVYVARISQGPVADAARRTLDVLTKRREDAKARLGTDDPFILASVLKDYISNKAYEARVQKLQGLRLFPLDRRIIREADLEFNQFPQILAYWRSKDGPFGGRQPKQWIDLYRDLGARSAA